MRIALLPPLPPSPSHQPISLSRLNPIRFVRSYYRELFHPVIPLRPSVEIEAVRVAILIAMPSVDSRLREKARGDRTSTGSASSDVEHTGEMALGIAELPWEWSESTLEPPDSEKS